MLFLDVDGPLLPFGADPIDLSPNTEPGPARSRLTHAIGHRLAALPCELVWATTWEEEANTHLAPLLGLPPLPVVRWPEPTASQIHEDRWFGLSWKTRTLVTWAAGRPFAWVDDEITEADREWVAGHHPAPAFLRQVDCFQGLTDTDFEVLHAWLRTGPARPML